MYKCHGVSHGIAIRMAKSEVWGLGNDGARAGLGTGTVRTCDVPRFRALVLR